MKATTAVKHDTKWVFIKQGSCSRTLFYILNRDFGYPMEEEERAADPLAGGVLLQGYQCGFLWGATMAVGAEAFRRSENPDQAVGLAMKAGAQMVESFRNRAKCTDCYDITQASWTKTSGVVKYFATGKMVTCFKLADRWAPEAIKAAKEGLNTDTSDLPEKPVSCASEVVRKMCAGPTEMAIVAGFAGGIGLSGGGCGALSAAIWMNSLKWCRENPGKSGYPNPRAKETLDAFLVAADYEFECPKLAGRRFSSVSEHSEFVKCGGCQKIIDALAAS